MPIAEREVKLLWGRAAGFCSNPECRILLSSIEKESEPFLFGEMAHIVARNIGGPRSSGQVGGDIYANLILLCPTCHTKVDKAPDQFPVNLLRDWKGRHEAWIQESLTGSKLETAHELGLELSKLLNENNYFFRKYGPRSELADTYPDAPEFAIWLERRLDTIVPNNCRIVSLIELNEAILSAQFLAVALSFKDHALAFERHIFNRMERYPLFPQEFAEQVDRLAHER